MVVHQYYRFFFSVKEMVTIPANEVTQKDLEQWYAIQNELKALKATEMLLRQKIFKGYFTEPKEGTNTAPLAHGWVLKGTYVLNRDVDLATMGAMKEQFIAAGVSTDTLVQFKPSLVVKEYRTLTEEQRHLFDRALIIKPGAPSLEIMLPAKAKKVGDGK